MIKGVHKQVIEISDTGNDCFERAILFVRPSSQVREGELLNRRGREYLGGLRVRRWPWGVGVASDLLKVAGGAAAGALAAALLFLCR